MGVPEIVTEPVKYEKPEWYQKTVRRFKSYHLDQKKVQVLKTRLAVQLPSQTTSYTHAPSFTVGNNSDQTGNFATKRTELEDEIRFFEQRIHEVKIIFEAFGELEQQLIEKRYFDRHAKDWFVARNLDLPLRSYYRFRDEVIFISAEMFLYVNRDQVSFEELGWWD